MVVYYAECFISMQHMVKMLTDFCVNLCDVKNWAVTGLDIVQGKG